MTIRTFTQHNGRKVGIPQGTVVFIVGLEATPSPQYPKAKTMIRYSLGGGEARHAYVRDSYKHVRNLFPISLGGAGWTEVTDAGGNDVAFPAGTIRAWEELETEEPTYRLTIGCETGPLEFNVKATWPELKAMMGEQAAEDEEEAGEPAAEEPPPQKGR